METPHNTTFRDPVTDIRKILDVDQNIDSEYYLKQLIQNISNVLGVKYAFIGHALESDETTIETDVVWTSEGMQPNFRYGLESTPCEIVMSGDRVCIHEKNVISAFPDDLLLQQMDIESYVGAPSITLDNKLLGLLVLLDDKPIDNVDYVKSIVEFLSQRITIEYERFKLMSQLDNIVKERTRHLIQDNRKLSENIEKLKIVKQELEEKSREDSLTHTFNRECFLSMAESHLKAAENNEYDLALLFIDLDHFKEINDNYGHLVGDHVLQRTANRIKACTRDTDILARYGGEEFVLLSLCSHESDAHYLAERILHEVAHKPITSNEEKIHVTTSIGISLSTTDGCDLHSLVEHADNALYCSKDKGRNTYTIYREKR